MARSGAKSPMAGVFSGAVVVLALYVLTPAFYYIPESVLASVIIHAVVDLVSGPKFLKALWKASILEFFIFAAAVVITCFMDVETGIYVSVGLSLLLMLLRLARPNVSSLGRVKLDVQQHHHLPPAPARYNVSPATSSTSITQQRNFVDPSVISTTNALDDIYGMDKQARYIYVEENNPLYNRLFDPLPPGVVVIQLSNSILYPNASYVSECISDIVKSRTRAGNRQQENSNTTSKIEEERTWNQPIPSSKEDLIHRHALKPYLECIVLDFSAVNKLDATALHTLHAIKQAMNRYAGGKEVEWHFCHIVNNHVRELLIESGFGLLPPSSSHQAHEAEEAMADMEIMKSGAQHAEEITKPQTFGSTDGRSLKTMNSLSDPMTVNYSNILASPTSSSSPQQANSNDAIVLLPFDRYPAFHWDMEAAVYSICERRQYQYQYTNNHSSITVTTAY
jgi:MFS superfamily sulfate permease-like transporter